MNRILTCCLAAASVWVAGCTAAPPAQPDWRAAEAAADACVPRSASRIPEGSAQCSSGPGHAYSQEDIRRTGQPNVGDALQMLDPSVTVHH
jgi:hypothetical protein